MGSKSVDVSDNTVPWSVCVVEREVADVGK